MFVLVMVVIVVVAVGVGVAVVGGGDILTVVHFGMFLLV